MPSVISKYLNPHGVQESFIGNREYLSKALIASSLILYGCKISYPILMKVCNPQASPKGTTKETVTNSSVLRSEQNGVYKSKDGLCNGTPVNGKNKLTDNNNKITVANGNLLGAKCQLTIDTFEGDAKRSKPKKKMLSVGFDREFIIRLYKLLRLMIPNVVCKETGLLFIHTCALTVRTFLSIFVASMEGQMVKFIVRKDVKNFAYMILKWLAVAVPATFINSLIRYLECKLALAFR